jgi:hypothetical protein
VITAARLPVPLSAAGWPAGFASKNANRPASVGDRAHLWPLQSVSFDPRCCACHIPPCSAGRT